MAGLIRRLLTWMKGEEYHDLFSALRLLKEQYGAEEQAIINGWPFSRLDHHFIEGMFHDD